MGLFDRLKKKEQAPETTERLENFPQMLNARLLFINKPILDADNILTELKFYFNQVDNPSNGKALLYFFPDIQVELKDATLPAQCSILILDEKDSKVEIPAEAFQQNWHWKEAEETAGKWQYEVLITDFMTRTLDYKMRLDLFMKFLVAVSKATNPAVIYIVNSQKLISPISLVTSWDGQVKEVLFGIANVRLYNISNNDKKGMLMDTVGLSSLGLPDFQMRFIGINENSVAGLLWDYAYYIFEQGDIIESGNTLMGLEPNSKWRCERQVSLAGPERIVINVQPS